MMQDQALAYTVCPDDAGILYSDDLAAARLIREPGIRLVHIRQSAPVATTLFSAISNPAFFSRMDEMVTDAIVFGHDPASFGLPDDELAAFRALLECDADTRDFMRQAGLKPSDSVPEFRTRLNGYFNSLAGTIWHTDPVHVVSVAVEGPGTEYLIGEITPRDITMMNVMREPPAHVRTARTEPGDVLVMKGRTQFRPGEPDPGFEVAASRAIFHRGVTAVSRRTVLLYPFV